MKNKRSSLVVMVLAIAFTGLALAAPKDEMMDADRAFSALSAEKGNHAAFLAYMTDDARLYRGEHPPLLGKGATEAAFAAEEKADPSYKSQTLVWSPLEGEASADGSFGFTRGSWTFSAPKSGGGTIRETGYYVTMWRRQADGTYKFCLDIGGTDKPSKP